MLLVSNEMQAHIGLDLTTLALCWRIRKKNNSFIFGTEHDENIRVEDSVLGGLYLANAGITGSDVKSTSDMSVPNMEVQGALRDNFTVADVTVADIESGILNGARVDIFLVNWDDPSQGIIIRRSGIFGQIERDSSGIYRTEVLGLTWFLSQNIGRTDGERCNAVFGDARCKFPIATKTRTGTVTAVASRRAFDVTLDAGPAPLSDTYYNFARLKFTSGDNTDFERETKRVLITGDDIQVELWEESPDDIEIGDTISLPPGCDQSLPTCRDIHANIENMRATGIFIPGALKMIQGPDTL